MPKSGSIVGAEGRRVFTADPVLNLLICVYLLAIEDSQKSDIPFSTDPMSKKLIANAPDWLASETGQAVYKYIKEGLTNA